MARVRRHGNVPFICRIDQPEKSTFGWYLRVASTGGRVARFFSDSKYGSREKSKAAAVRERDEILGNERMAAA